MNKTLTSIAIAATLISAPVLAWGDQQWLQQQTQQNQLRQIEHNQRMIQQNQWRMQRQLERDNRRLEQQMRQQQWLNDLNTIHNLNNSW